MSDTSSTVDSPSSRRVLAGVLGKRYPVFTPRGTAALEVALLAAGVRPGDDVVVPEECCPAVPGSVVRVGARPVLAALDERLVLDAASVRAALTPRVRAVIAVHQWGSFADCGQLRAALPDTVALVEDAAQYWRPLPEPAAAGTRGDLVVVSFSADKPLTIGWGGAVGADDPALLSVVGLDGADLRQLPEPVAPLHVPAPPAATLAAAIADADAAYARRRAVAHAVRDAVAGSRVTVVGRIDETNCWHRVVLRLPPDADPAAAAAAGADHGLRVLPPYPRPLADSALLRGRAIPPPGSRFQEIRDRLLLLWPPTDDDGRQRATRWVRSLRR